MRAHVAVCITAVVGIVAAQSDSPSAQGRPIKVLYSAPLGTTQFRPAGDTIRWDARVVNISGHDVTASIVFCDEAGACHPGGSTEACNSVHLSNGHACDAEESVAAGAEQSRYIKIFLSGTGTVNARGALRMTNFEGTTAVEAH